MEYRVLESKGVFSIQVLEEVTTTSGILWWKKTLVTEKWAIADEMGYPYHYYPRLNLFSPMKSFNSLDKALARIKVLTSPPKIHYPNEQVSK